MVTGYVGNDGTQLSIDSLISRGLIEIKRDIFLTNVDVSLSGKLVLPLEIIPTKNSLENISNLEICYCEPSKYSEEEDFFEAQSNYLNSLEKGV